MHSMSGRFCSAVPGMLVNHSVFESWAARSLVLRKAISTRAVFIAASASFESIGLTEFHPRSILHSTSIGLLGSVFGDGRLRTRVCRYPSLAQEMVMSPGL